MGTRGARTNLLSPMSPLDMAGEHGSPSVLASLSSAPKVGLAVTRSLARMSVRSSITDEGVGRSGSWLDSYVRGMLALAAGVREVRPTNREAPRQRSG